MNKHNIDRMRMKLNLPCQQALGILHFILCSGYYCDTVIGPSLKDEIVGRRIGRPEVGDGKEKASTALASYDNRYL